MRPYLTVVVRFVLDLNMVALCTNSGTKKISKYKDLKKGVADIRDQTTEHSATDVRQASFVQHLYKCQHLYIIKLCDWVLATFT